MEKRPTFRRGERVRVHRGRYVFTGVVHGTFVLDEETYVSMTPDDDDDGRRLDVPASRVEHLQPA